MGKNDPADDGQLTLGTPALRRIPRGDASPQRPRTRKDTPLAAELPVARVVVDKGLLHLDRLFDYAVPGKLADVALPGVRVRVRFGATVVGGRRTGGGLLDGVIVERAEHSDYTGPLAPLERVVSPEIVFPAPMIDLARAVADRYAGTLAGVIQLALPSRHKRAEDEPAPPALPAPAAPAPGTWTRYRGGADHLTQLAAGESPRSVWTALPGPHWPDEVARAVTATLASGRGALVVVPDGKTVDRVDAALDRILGPGRHIALTAGLGPEERYRRWLAVSRGSVRAVVGTRAAMFAPVADLGLALVWDDGDGAHAELHAPHPHVREVLAMRALREGAAFTAGGHATTVEAAQLVRTGWAHPLEADRDRVRATAPRVRVSGADSDLARDAAARAARLPSLAWQTARAALATGPVLVQVPRRGYLVRTACQRCREPARCTACSGPLQLPTGDSTLTCGWCARPEPRWQCAVCGGTRLRASVVGARRTAEELGRAFPTIPVRTSGRDTVLPAIPDLPALIVATPGAEPVAPTGYAAALLLDTWALLNRPDMRAGEEALRRWLGAASLVRPASEGGVVVIVAESALRPVQALVRWDPQGHARSELTERAELDLPPVSRMASVTGTPEAIADLLALARLPDGTDVLGPVPLPPPTRPIGPAIGPATTTASAPEAGFHRDNRTDGRTGQRTDSRPTPHPEPENTLFGPAPARPPGGPPPAPAPQPHERMLLRVPPGHGAALARALKTAQALRLARKAPDPVQVRIDPTDLG